MPPIERAARALCRFHGHPEDEDFWGRPRWESFILAAGAVLDALRGGDEGRRKRLD